MNKLKVTNKKTIAITLLLGGSLHYSRTTAKVYLRDAAGELLGTVRFNTFLHWPTVGGGNASDPLAITTDRNTTWSTGETFRLPRFIKKG